MLVYRHLHVERYINKTSSLLLKDTGRSLHKQYNYSLLQMLLYAKNYYKYFNSGMQLVRWPLYSFINPLPPLKAENVAACQKCCGHVHDKGGNISNILSLLKCTAQLYMVC